VTGTLLKKMPAPTRTFSVHISRALAVLSVLLWWWLSLPILSAVGAATLTYWAVLGAFVVLWRTPAKSSKGKGRSRKR
jgi:hypothetical protein